MPTNTKQTKRWTPIILIVLTIAVAIILLIKSGLLSIMATPADSRTATPVDARRVSETRVIGAETVNITLGGSITLNLKQGNIATMVVTARKDQLDKIETQQKGDTLEIHPKDDTWFINGVRGLINRDDPVIVDITLPELKNVALAGSGDANIIGFSGDQLELAVAGSGAMQFKGQYKKVSGEIAGSGSIKFDGATFDEMELDIMGSGIINASGQSKLLTADLAGSGSLHAGQLIADTATISIAGSGNADIFAKQAVDISVTGSGNVRVHGKPPKHEVNSAGSGTVSFD